ncbi:hypothetical protein [Streptomyces sp. NPDC058385]|uniref:hypothetical protein n=1 Tax=Streptomyces sp. NPDC058385 TaxID=3346473 RepID=UPI003657203C
MHQAATWAASVAFETGARRPLELRKHTYAEIRLRWGLGAQAAQHAIKKTCDAYTILRANLRNGRYGRSGTRRHTRAAGKPVVFRPDAAQPYDDRMLSWRHQARTVSGSRRPQRVPQHPPTRLDGVGLRGPVNGPRTHPHHVSPGRSRTHHSQ